MKKLLLSLCAAGALFTSSAQTSLTEAVDFTVTFTDGTEFNLFDKLAEGKYVCIDWFFTTCGPCQANQPTFTETFQNFGCNEGDIFFLSVENTVDDAAVIVYEETFAGENAPPAASGTEGGGIDAENLWNISAFPTFVLVAPDGTVVEQDMWPLTDGAETFTNYFAAHDLNPMPCTTSIDEAVAAVSAYPNPAQDELTVDLTGFNGTVEVEVYSLLGESVATVTTTGTQAQVDLSTLAAGNYVLRASDATQTLQQHVIVAR